MSCGMPAIETPKANLGTRYIPALGAWIVILSLAFDTFVQQVLTLETKIQQVKLSGSSLTTGNILPRRQIYNTTGGYSSWYLVELPKTNG